jgi:hypothetical protein
MSNFMKSMYYIVFIKRNAVCRLCRYSSNFHSVCYIHVLNLLIEITTFWKLRTYVHMCVSGHCRSVHTTNHFVIQVTQLHI